MQELIKKINVLKKNNKVRNEINKKIKKFKKLQKSSSKELFKELCFCILTANFQAQRCIEIQEKIGNGFINLSLHDLAKTLKKYGHRFPNARAKYIVENRKYSNNLKKNQKEFKKEKELRKWLSKNIKGVFYKEASHFLRNIGYDNIAIIDFHIIDILVKNKLIKKPKTVTKKKYLEIEKVLDKIAKKTSLTLAKLDFYLWYAETGKILK